MEKEILKLSSDYPMLAPETKNGIGWGYITIIAENTSPRLLMTAEKEKGRMWGESFLGN
jgi:hypothetical protein